MIIYSFAKSILRPDLSLCVMAMKGVCVYEDQDPPATPGQSPARPQPSVLPAALPAVETERKRRGGRDEGRVETGR